MNKEQGPISTHQQALNARHWLGTLLTTRYPQGKGRLGDAGLGYCCLGVGCKILDVPYHYDSGFSTLFSANVGLKRKFPAVLSDEDAPFFDGIKPSIRRKLLDEPSKASLFLREVPTPVHLNDTYGLNFREIGQVIGANLDYYFEPHVARAIRYQNKKLLEELA